MKLEGLPHNPPNRPLVPLYPTNINIYLNTPEVKLYSEQMGINLPQLTRNYRYAFQWQAQAKLHNTLQAVGSQNLPQEAAELVKTITAHNSRTYSNPEQYQAHKEIITSLNEAVSKTLAFTQVNGPEQVAYVCDAIKYLCFMLWWRLPFRNTVYA